MIFGIRLAIAWRKNLRETSKDIAKDFSAYFSNLVENLVNKLSNPLNKYGVLSVAQYYRHSTLGLTCKYGFAQIEKDYIFLIWRDINTSKAAGTNKLPGRFLKVGADVLAKPVLQWIKTP